MLAAPLAAQPEPGHAADVMEGWLAQMDFGPDGSWELLAPEIQQQITREAWGAQIQQAREPYGRVTSRRLEDAETVARPAGAPPGTYVRVRFTTRFAGGASASETVFAMHDGARWRAAGYFITQSGPAGPDYSAPADAPYTAADVTVPTPAGHTLAGTLTVPKGASNRVPAVVLISGSGLQDRDSGIPGIAGYRFFRQIADALGRRGIAVLRLDDRGWGASGGDPSTATTMDLADDTRAAVAWLRARGEIDPARVGLVGHSEGGIIAPMVAAEDAQIAAVALLAGQGWTGRRTSDYQLHRAWSAMGLSQAEMDSMAATNDPIREQQAAHIPWLQWWMDFDPAPTLRRVRAPALVLQGATDWQVAPEQAADIATALREGANRDVTLRVFPGLNHLFVPDSGGEVSPSAYARLPSKEVPAEVLGALADWLVERLRAR
ncbi:MAG TPA: alpha/beta fold hydrolase [Longimicrobium sp.]|nr:alpha/beta fold hydrolase [Longimicrobium sp.]